MTTREDLIALATSKPVPASPEILTAIEEARIQADSALAMVVSLATTASTGKPHAVVQGLPKYAVEYEIAAGKLNTLFLTLACVLSAAGIQHEY